MTAAPLVIAGAEHEGRVIDIRIAGGRVTAVEPDLPRTGERVVAAAGGAVLPGLHDHHIHLLAMAAANRSVHVGPSDVGDAHGFAAALHAADHALPRGAWIRAVGYHQSVAGELDRWALDRIVADRPVRVQHRSGGLWVLNSAAAAAVGADAASSGRLFRMDEWLRQRLPAEPPDMRAVGAQLLRYGVTGVTDATPYTDVADMELLAEAVADGSLPQRVVVTGSPMLGRPPTGLEPGPAKILLPDHDLPDLATLVSMIDTARQRGRSVAVHCVTATALALTIAALEDVGAQPGDRIEHGAVIPVEAVPVLVRLGVCVVTQPNFVAERGDEYATDVDESERGDLWRCRSLMDAGLAVAGGTDAPFGTADPWRAIEAAVERRTPTGLVLGDGERISPRAALDLFLGEPHRPGGPPRRVQTGAAADLCILDRPLAGALDDPAAVNVVATIVRGEPHLTNSGS